MKNTAARDTTRMNNTHRTDVLPALQPCGLIPHEDCGIDRNEIEINGGRNGLFTCDIL